MKKMRESMVLREVLPTMGLPDLSTFDDGSGRHLSWIYCIGAPGLFYGSEWIDIDDWWIDNCISDFAKLTAGGYEPPVIREHTVNGEREGSMLALVKYQAPEGPSIAAAVRWAIPDAEEQIRLGRIRYFSPGVMLLEHSDTGELVYTIRELSMTSCPHQKGATTHILAAEDAALPPKESAMNPEEQARLAQVEQNLAAIQSVLEGMQKTLTEMQPKPADETIDDYLKDNPQVAALGESAAKGIFNLGKDARKAFAASLVASEKPKAQGSSTSLMIDGVRVDGVLSWDQMKKKHNGNIKAAEAEYKLLRKNV